MHMKAALMQGPGMLSIDDVPDPSISEGGILLEMVACAICGTDAKMLEAGHRDLVYPRILGHEIVGRVLSKDVRGYQEGDLVQVWPGIACSECRPCSKGIDNQCSVMKILGFNRDGGFAQKIALPAQTIRNNGLVKLPDRAEPRLISLAEPLACCLNGQELARVGKGDTVLIFGAGPIGCLHAMLARQMGAEKVLMTEHLDSRRKMLPKGLADRIIDPGQEDITIVVKDETGGEGVDVVLMSTPEVRVDSWLLRLMAPQGRISMFSGPKKGNYEVPFDVRSLHYKEICLVGAYGCSSRQNREAVTMILDGRMDVAWLVTEEVALNDLPRTFERINLRQGMKSVVTRF
jgi:L-iditol 2-dehydrogenase